MMMVFLFLVFGLFVRILSFVLDLFGDFEEGLVDSLAQFSGYFAPLAVSSPFVNQSTSFDFGHFPCILQVPFVSEKQNWWIWIVQGANNL